MEEKTSTPVEIMQHVLRKLSQDSFGHTDLEGLVGSRWWSQKNAGLSPSQVCARGRDWVTIHMNWVLEAMRLDRLITRDGLKGKGSEGKWRKERMSRAPLLRRRRKSVRDEGKEIVSGWRKKIPILTPYFSGTLPAKDFNSGIPKWTQPYFSISMSLYLYLSVGLSPISQSCVSCLLHATVAIPLTPLVLILLTSSPARTLISCFPRQSCRA